MGNPLLFVLSAILFGSVCVVVANAFIHVLNCLLGRFQGLFAMSAFIVSSSLQFFRGCLQVTKGFLHVGVDLQGK
jgi:hypothetical protein